MDTKSNICPVILGRTGSGKTNLIKILAKSLQLELIACDKFYSYSYFETSVCRPKNDYHGMNVHLVGFRHPLEPLMDRIHFSDLVCDVVRKVNENGVLPIAEGCSFGYISALIQNMHKNSDVNFTPLIGITLPPALDFNSFYKNKVEELINNGAIQEVEYAVNNNWINSYVLNKSMLANTLLRYIQKEISLENAIEIATNKFIRIAEEEEAKFKTIPGVMWFEHVPGNSDETASQIHDCLVNMYDYIPKKQ
ncbi:MAG: hypothetical protein JJE30_11305 [Desulfuromonadales bacterium]|nr:hypothetical protein [Desulfuromonadales bacterium]